MNLQFGQKTDDFIFGYGICQCGCGKKTPLLYNGEHAKHVNSQHHPRAIAKRDKEKLKQTTLPGTPNTTGILGEEKTAYEKGWGFCQCGCGEKTKIFAGKANRFVVGHSSKSPEFRAAQSRRAVEQIQNRECSPFFRYGRSISGTHFSSKIERDVNFMSLYEKKAYEILDSMESVASYQDQPFTISYEYNGQPFTYIPDILVYLTDGSIKLLEVKPAERLSSPRVQAKHAAAEVFCIKKGWAFMVLTEVDLFRNERIDF
jgi:hypothetical protein